jgi:hypothetical protein
MTAMRSVMKIGWLAIALTFIAPAAVVAQEAIALAIEGWRQETRSDGVTYYRCASKICAAGSVVSYKPQPHRTTITMDEFENHHQGLVKLNASNKNIRAVRLRDAKERTIEGVRVLQISREVDWADKTTTFSIESRLIGPDRSFSLVSDSPKREWTANNFAGFLARMVDIAGIKAPR